MFKLIFPLAFLASACAPIAVTGYNGNSIRIQSGYERVTRDVWSEAERICQTQGLHAEYASSRTGSDGLQSEHLFLCLTRTLPNAGMPAGQNIRPNYFDSAKTL